MALSEVFNMDCMDGMKQYPDKYFDLAIVDPPYGINQAKKKSYWGGANTTYSVKDWDKNVPNESYFEELFRISTNQIIWGGNYFKLPPKPKLIVWDKMQPEGLDQAMCELAWTSIINVQSMIFRRSPAADNNKVSNGDKRAMSERRRIHPTQKPVALYKWLLKNYAEPGNKILDTHLGSGSSRIAAYDMGFAFTGYEIDKDYFDAQEKRFNKFKSQLRLTL